MTWDIKSEEDEFEYEFSELEKNYIKREIMAISDRKELLAEQLDIYRLFTKE